MELSAFATTSTLSNTNQNIDNQHFTLELTTPVDDRRPVYVVGNFNNWIPEDPRFKMRRLSKGRFIYTFDRTPKLPAQLEYKYVRGGWENKELDTFGNDVNNRVLTKPKGVQSDFVPRWLDYGLNHAPAFLPKIRTVAEQFFIPQLQKHRRVVVLLPFDYDLRPDKRYPVLYLHDAQNLYDPNAPFGTWGIDKKLAVLAEKGMGDVIVVAIDHGDIDRVNEYLPPINNSKLGRSEGRAYIRFLAQTLKPHIDNHFRTLHDRSHTGIGGSSMGGLISIYAGLMFPEIFGKLMIFSPSLWAVRAAQMESIEFFQPIPTKIYAYGGGMEGSNMVPNMNRFQKAITQKGFDASVVQFKLVIDPQGMHNERRWGEEFPKAIEWLFFS
jgi:predicted alpha/beta superfamily hydrolase